MELHPSINQQLAVSRRVSLHYINAVLCARQHVQYNPIRHWDDIVPCFLVRGHIGCVTIIQGSIYYLA